MAYTRDAKNLGQSHGQSRAGSRGLGVRRGGRGNIVAMGSAEDESWVSGSCRDWMRLLEEADTEPSAEWRGGRCGKQCHLGRELGPHWKEGEGPKAMGTTHGMRRRLSHRMETVRAKALSRLACVCLNSTGAGRALRSQEDGRKWSLGGAGRGAEAVHSG